MANVSFWQKVKIGFAALTGGVPGLVKALLDWFNSNVLSRISDPAEAALYCKDVKDLAFFLRSVLTRHSGWMSESSRNAFVAVIDAIDCLAAALEDCKFTPEELDGLVDAVKAAIDAWKKARGK